MRPSSCLDAGPRLRGRSRAPSCRPCRSGSASGSRSRCRGGRARACSSISTTSAVIACGTSSFVAAAPARARARRCAPRAACRCHVAGRVVHRPLGQQRDQVGAQLVDAVAGLRADRMQRVEVAERAAVFICVAMCPAFSRSILLSAITTGHAELEDAARDEAVARADALARVEDEQHDVEVVARSSRRRAPASARSAGRSASASRAGRRARAARRRSCARRGCGGASCAACRRRSRPSRR